MEILFAWWAITMENDRWKTLKATLAFRLNPLWIGIYKSCGFGLIQIFKGKGSPQQPHISYIISHCLNDLYFYVPVFQNSFQEKKRNSLFLSRASALYGIPIAVRSILMEFIVMLLRHNYAKVVMY